MPTYLVQEKENKLMYLPAQIIDKEALGNLDHELRLRILELLAKKPMYPAELAKKLDLHEQKIYYHIKQLLSAGVLSVVEKKEIRGTIAKRYGAQHLNFAVVLQDNWKPAAGLLQRTIDEKLKGFLSPFIEGGVFNGHIVVGSPDPHGPNKTRARDGHYAIDLALFLGTFCTINKFSVVLDVDVRAKNFEQNNLIVVGGPLTNVLASTINEHLPIPFADRELISRKARYTDDAIGLIARMSNPFNPEKTVLFFAGISALGTKAAILCFTRHYHQLLTRYSGQASFAAVVQGYDLDSDGTIESVEILE